MHCSRDHLIPTSWLANGAKCLSPLILFSALLGCAPQAVPYPQPGMAIWNGENGGSIQGHATLRSGPSGYARTCAGLDAYIVPVKPETTTFIQRHFNQVRDGFAPSFSVEDTLGAFVTSNGGGRVPCREDGTFTFAGVASGQYYILADIKWLLHHAPRGGTVSSVANVSAARTDSIAISVWLNSNGGTPDVSR